MLSFSDLLKIVSAQSALLLFAVIGIVVVLLSWRRAPKASIWALIAFLLLFVSSIAMPIGHHLLFRMMHENRFETENWMRVMSIYSFVWSIVRGAIDMLLLVAVYMGRSETNKYLGAGDED